jgi:hypothetical protein
MLRDAGLLPLASRVCERARKWVELSEGDPKETSIGRVSEYGGTGIRPKNGFPEWQSKNGCSRTSC